MPINRYQIRNVYSLAHPELYKASGKDDPEALLEGVAMAGLVGVLRQLGDLAEFAAEIFHDLHEEVMSTAARGHGLLVRVQQLESEIPPIERAFLSQTSHSAFFLNSGVDWHPKGQTTQNLITTGDLPRFVMDSYEECRGPPRLFLLDKFDVGGAGACLKRYTDPSIFKVEESSDEIEIAETLREKKIRQTKKNASKCKGGETPEVSPSTHAKLHQLFLEEPMQTDETEAACHVKLKKLPKKSPFGSENYMNKLLDSPSCAHEVAHTPSNESRFEDSNIMGSPMKNTSPCVSSSKVAESQPSYDNEITVNDENNSTTKAITVSGNPDVSKVTSVDQVENLEDGTLDTNEVCFTPMILVPNILEATKNQTGYDLEIHSTDSVVSSSQSVISDQAEGETKSDNLETESVTIADANKNEDSVLKDEIGTESTYSDVKRDDDSKLNPDSKESADDVDENKVDQVKHQSSPVLSDFPILPKLPPVKVEDPPPLPPLPPMQWRMRNLQKYWSTRMNYSQHNDNHQEVAFSGTHTENQNPHTQHNEVFWPSSSPYSLPLVLDDKNKLRKVSDRDTIQILKGEERDTLLDQIRAKSVNLKPAVQTRPSIQGPTTNLRVVAILEKANAIRQAFAGSDDDESDNWSDS